MAVFFIDIDKLNLEFIQKGKVTKKMFLKYYLILRLIIAIPIEIMWCQKKHRHVNQLNNIEVSEIGSHKDGKLNLDKDARNQWKSGGLFTKLYLSN